jgi:ParB/RepB/Spo0J family partition protein
MAEQVRLVDPKRIEKNKENPRLIFREDELNSLQDSIEEQGILVPLTVFEDARRFVILDGERRWRCALKLNLDRVPVIVQPKPDRLQNIMMMFAIHKARADWDPLPTAMKLKQLEDALTARHEQPPTEEALSAAASLSRGEVRRLRRILSIPDEFKAELMLELEKPREKQILTVDHVLEAVRGAESLRKREVINRKQEVALSKAIVQKFKNNLETSTVSPRLLPKISRAVERGELPVEVARAAVGRIISERTYTVADAFRDSAAQSEFEHTVEQVVSRLTDNLREHLRRRYKPSKALTELLRELREAIDTIIRR